MAGYQVNHAQLTEAGKQIAQHGEGSSEIQGKISDANVPPQSWGLLGIELLFPIYLTLLTDLESHLGKMQQHLTDTGDTLVQTAKAYQEMDDRAAKDMQKVMQQMDEGGSAVAV